MESLILARTERGAEHGMLFAAGTTTSIVTPEIGPESATQLEGLRPDLIVVEAPVSEVAWIEAALAVIMPGVTPDTEICLVVDDPDMSDIDSQDAIVDALQGWMVKGVTVRDGIVGLLVSPSSDLQDVDATSLSFEGALQMSRLMRTVIDPLAVGLPEFAVRSSETMAYLRQVPRLKADIERLRNELESARAQSDRLQDLAAEKTRDLEEAELVNEQLRELMPDRPAASAGSGSAADSEGAEAEPPPPGRGSRRTLFRIGVVGFGALVWAAGAWFLADLLDGGMSSFLSLLVLGAVLGLAFDSRRRSVTANARLGQVSRAVTRLDKRVAREQRKASASLGRLKIQTDRHHRAAMARITSVDNRGRDQAASLRRVTDSLTELEYRVDQLITSLGHVSALMESSSSRLMAAMPRSTDVAGLVKRDLLTTYNQIESNLRLRDVVEVTGPTPQLRGWAASPDVIAMLVREMHRVRARVVVECGSGASTIWLAMAAKALPYEVRIVALEHEDVFAAETRRFLDECGVGDVAEVRYAPLEEITLGDHEGPWYARSALDGLDDVGLVFVDGPPGILGPRSRYPALPLLRQHLAATASVVLDDLIRDDERETAEIWSREYPEMQMTEIAVEKGAAIFRLEAGNDD